MAKTKQRYISNYEWLSERERAQRRFAESRDDYLRRSGRVIYRESAAAWHRGHEEAYISWEADRRKRLNAEILMKVNENSKPYGVCRERGEFTRAERDIIEAIFSLARFSCDLYAAIETIANMAKRSVKMVKLVRNWLEDAGLLVRVYTGGRGRDEDGWGITSRFQIRYDKFRELYGIAPIKKITMREICEEFNAAVAAGKEAPRMRTRMGRTKEKRTWRDFFKGLRTRWVEGCGKQRQKEVSEQGFYPLISLNNNKEPITAPQITKSPPHYPPPLTENSPQPSFKAPLFKERRRDK